MKINHKMGYPHVLYLLAHGLDFSYCVDKFKIIAGPDFHRASLLGYIETNVEFEVSNLNKFSELLGSWYALSENERFRWHDFALSGKWK